ncbi:MAG TPA: extracellular solute-binding protein [Trueperaceae bacterium]|nr:extracellular solute-binding protein [Trueperaceae bacterium]
MRLRRFMLVLTAAAVAAGLAATAAAQGGKTTVTFWDAYSSDGPEVKQLETVIIPAFEKAHPDITVKNVTIPYDQLHQKLITAVAGAQLPDLVRSDIIWVPELANLGVLAPLDQAMPDFKSFSDAIFPGPLATNFWKGHYYGLPLDTNTRIFVYDPATLKKLGLEGPPTTFDELKSMSATAKAQGVYLYGESGTSGWNLLPWIWSAGGRLTNDSYTRASGYLDGPKSVAAVQMLVDLYNAGELPNIIVNPNGGLGTYDGITQGKYAGMLDGPWSFAIFASAHPDTKLAGSLVPAGTGGSVSVVGGEDIVLTQQSKNKQAALEFLRFMLGDFAQRQMAEAGQMPVLESSEGWLPSIDGYYATYLQQIKTARPRTPTPKWPQIDSVLQTEIAKAFQGSKTVQQALTDAAKQIDALLQ